MKIENNAKLVTDNRVLGGICRKYGMQYYKSGVIYERNGAPEILEYKGMAYILVIVYARNKSLQTHLFIAETGKNYEKYMKELGLEATKVDNKKRSHNQQSSIMNDSECNKACNKKRIMVVPYDTYGNVYLLRKEVEKTQVYYELPSGYYLENGKLDEKHTLGKCLQVGLSVKTLECLGEMQLDKEMGQDRVMISRALVVSNEVIKPERLGSGGIVRVSEPELLELIARNQIICGKTLASLMRYLIIV